MNTPTQEAIACLLAITVAICAAFSTFGCATGSGVVNINYKAIQDSQGSQINQSTSATLKPLK